MLGQEKSLQKIILAMLLVFSLFLISACGNRRFNSEVLSLEDALQMFQDGDNYTLEMTVDFFNVIEVTMKTTETLTYVHAVDAESMMKGYVDRSTGISTAYTTVDESEPWTKSIIFNPVEAVLERVFSIFDMVGFEAEWFEQVDDFEYRILDDYKANFFNDPRMQLQDFILTLGPGSVLFDIQARTLNTDVQLLMQYQDLGETTLTLPDFHAMIDGDGFDDGIGYDIDIPADLRPIDSGFLVDDIVNSHTLVISEAGEYAIWSQSFLATVGQLFLNDRLIDEDDIMGPGFNFMLKRHLEPGTYRLDVRNFVFEDSGPYEVYVMRIED